MRTVAFAAGMLCVSAIGGAANAQRIEFRTYGRMEGLTNAWFSCLEQGRSGYVFACTDHGIYVYDGRRFLNLGPHQGLPDGDMASGLVFDRHDRLIVRYPHSVFVSSGPIGPGTPPAALSFQAASSLVGSIPTDAYGRMVIYRGEAIFDGGGQLYRVRTDTGQGRPVVELAETLLGTTGVGLAESTPLAVLDSSLWAVRSDEAICRFGRAPSRCYGPSDGLPADKWVALLATTNGHLVARSASRLADLDPARGTVVLSSLPDQGGQYANYQNTLRLAQTPSGQLLTQSATGLMIQDGSGWRTLATDNGLPSTPIARLMFDRSGDLWLGALGRGVMRALGYGAWENLDHRDGLADDMIWQVAREPGGPLWVASDGGVDAVGGPADGRAPAHRHYGEAAFSLALDGYGHLWRSVGSDAIEAITLETGHTTRYPLPQTNLILHGSGGRLWFATNRGVYDVVTGPVPAAPRPVAGLSGPVNDAAALDGTLWVLRSRELLRRDADGSIGSISLGWLPADYEPRVLGLGRHGTMWIAGAGGSLYRLHVEKDRVVSRVRFEPPDIISSSVVSLLVDSRNWLWVGTDDGLSVFNGRRWVSATTDVGLIWDDMNQSSLLEDGDGSIWMGTSQGLSHLLDPARLFADDDLRPVITSVIVGDTIFRERAVPFTRQPFFIQFGALDFRADGVVRFRYRLDGVDAAWADTAGGYARYPSVPPGHHRFELVAYDPLTHRASAPVSMVLRVSGPWWVSWPLLVLYLVAAGALGAGLLQLWDRRLLRQQRLLQREVDLRTAEIREAQATDSLTTLLTRGEVQNRLVTALGSEHRTSQITVGLLDIDHFKRTNDRFGHLAGDEILTEIGRRLRLALRPGEYAGRYGGEEILIVIESERTEIGRLRALKAAVCGAPFPVEGEVIEVTCSIGVAHEHGRDDWKSLIGRADKALYQAKEAGRDRVVVFEASTSLTSQVL